MGETWDIIGRDLEEDFHGTKSCCTQWQKRYRKLNTKNNVSLFLSYQGNLLTERKDVHRRWNEYFESLLNTLKEDSDMNIRDDGEEVNQVEGEDITEEEVTIALKHMRNNKASGTDEIPVDIFKYGGPHHLLPDMDSEIKKIPVEWGSAVICSVHKK